MLGVNEAYDDYNDRTKHVADVLLRCRVPHPKHPPYKALSGFGREDAIMVLRRFYITENVNGEFKIFFNPLSTEYLIYSP